MEAVCYHYVVTILSNPIEIEIPSICIGSSFIPKENFNFILGVLFFL